MPPATNHNTMRPAGWFLRVEKSLAIVCGSERHEPTLWDGRPK